MPWTIVGPGLFPPMCKKIEPVMMPRTLLHLNPIRHNGWVYNRRVVVDEGSASLRGVIIQDLDFAASFAS